MSGIIGFTVLQHGSYGHGAMLARLSFHLDLQALLNVVFMVILGYSVHFYFLTTLYLHVLASLVRASNILIPAMVL